MNFPGHLEQVFQQLDRQRTRGHLCDCLVVIGSRSFQAHRAVLAACSAHFRALLSVTEGDGGVGEVVVVGGSSGSSVIHVDSEVVTPEAFSALLDMMYTSTLALETCGIADLLLAASHLHLNAVVKACRHRLTAPPADGRTAPRHSHHQRSEVAQPQPPSPRAASTVSATASSTMQCSVSPEQLGQNVVSSALEGGAGVDVSRASHSEGMEEEPTRALPARRPNKRKSSSSPMPTPEDQEPQSPKQRLVRPSEDQQGELGSVSESRDVVLSNREEQLPFPDRFKADWGLGAQVGDTETEEKYEASMSPQMPSQSHDSVGGAGQGSDNYHGELKVNDGFVIKIKELEEEEEERKMKLVVVKSENLPSFLDMLEVSDVTSLKQDSSGQQGATESEEPAGPLSPACSDGGAPEPQSSMDRTADTCLADQSASNASQGLGGQQSLGLSCPQSPKSMSAAGSAGQDSLPKATTGEVTVGVTVQSAEAANPSPSYSSTRFSDTFILQLAQEGSLGGILRAVGRSLDFTLQPSPSQPSRWQAGGSRLGLLGYRRIAPKTSPSAAGDQPQDPPSSSSGGAVEGTGAIPQLASADVLSKCRKAQSEHNVLVVQGDRKYACRICCKTFPTLTDCKKHVRVHTGERPYACLKCGKCFSQSSHLYKHSKTNCLRWLNSPLPASLL